MLYVYDGDFETIRQLNEKKPYGAGFEIEKYECVGHVQKGIGKAFKTLCDKGVIETVGESTPGSSVGGSSSTGCGRGH